MYNQNSTRAVYLKVRNDLETPTLAINGDVFSSYKEVHQSLNYVFAERATQPLQGKLRSTRFFSRSFCKKKQFFLSKQWQLFYTFPLIMTTFDCCH